MDLTIPNHWNKLGVPVFFGNPILESNQFKAIKTIQDPAEGQIVYLDITKVPVLVIDVDDIKGTASKFEAYSRMHGGLEHLVWERTRNNGYHLFFYAEEKGPNILHKTFKGLHIDVLFKGRVFTSPSSWQGKDYVPGGKSILSIERLEELPVLPDWIDEILCN